jgi:hypothetical protein
MIKRKGLFTLFLTIFGSDFNHLRGGGFGAAFRGIFEKKIWEKTGMTFSIQSGRFTIASVVKVPMLGQTTWNAKEY